MSLVWLNSAIADLIRLRDFLEIHNKRASQEAAKKLIVAAQRILTFPEVGKPVKDLEKFRDLAEPFGLRGYVIRYRLEHEFIYIVHIRHYLEKDF